MTRLQTSLLQAVLIVSISLSGSGLMAQGVPGFGLRTVETHYFDYHHSQADTFDKIVPEDFKRCAAALAVMSYVLADLQ